jgi:hypothetical protein
MIQEGGYDFLNRISKEERLELSDFAAFMENRSIDIRFYVALPFKKQEKLLNAAQLMLNNMGDFGNSIGIFFASNKKCILAVPAKPLSIKIRRVFDGNDFLAEIKRKFLSAPESKGLVANPPQWSHVLQFKEKDGNPFLHYEVWLRKKKEIGRTIEVAFHVEFTKANERKKKLSTVLSKTSRELRKKKVNFKYEAKWGKHWSRVYTLHKINQAVLDDTVLDDVLSKLKALTSVSKPRFDKINWGR